MRLFAEAQTVRLTHKAPVLQHGEKGTQRVLRQPVDVLQKKNAPLHKRLSQRAVAQQTLRRKVLVALQSHQLQHGALAVRCDGGGLSRGGGRAEERGLAQQNGLLHAVFACLRPVRLRATSRCAAHFGRGIGNQLDVVPRARVVAVRLDDSQRVAAGVEHHRVGCAADRHNALVRLL